MKIGPVVLLLAASAASAQTVYKSVEDGVPTFSDTPPESGKVETITIDVPEASGDGLLEERLAAMRETTDRMADDRREREKHRAEIKALQSPSEPAPTVIEQQPLVVGGYWPSYYQSHRPRPPFRPGRPTPLPATPAPTPGWSVMQGGNSQLMRPIVSRRN